MPNHVHVVVKPLGDHKLEDIVHSWKSFTANKINALQGSSDKLWQADYYNRIIRDMEELYEQIKYVVFNPIEGNASSEFTGYNKELSQIELEVEGLRGQDAPATSSGFDTPTEAFTDSGYAINSPLIDGLPTPEAKKKITAWLEAEGTGQGAVNYKLRDWLFSRQRYWGEPFPIVWDEKTGQHFSVAEDELPVTLPEMEDFKPSGTPDPPLSKAQDWVRYSETARRETNTMPQWAGSCWYYLRFCDPRCDTAPVSKEAERYWMKNGVDLYIGGVEHAVLHLLYARFWHKVLFDYGVVSEPEPFQRLVNPGIILGADNQKMSKSLGNVVSPEDVMQLYGADSLRLFEMFIGPLTQMAPWSMSGVEGVHRFLARAWRLFMQENQEGQWEPSPAVDHSAEPSKEQLKVLHQTIRKVTDDIDALSFNTAISQMMVFVNELTRAETRPWTVLEPFLRLLSPFAPHLAGHLWKGFRPEKDDAMLMHQDWPVADEKYLVEDEVTLVLQVNGKVRDKVSVTAEEAQDKAHMEEIARANEKVLKFAEEGEIRKVIVVPGKLVNVVVK
jgi:leucyl-tRNA synthetase